MTTEKNEKLPISIEEIQKQKNAMRNLNTEIGRIIEITPEVREILGVYHEKEILARSIEILGNNLFKVDFIFPEFTLVKEKLDHVSSVQMQAAVNQGCLIAYGLAIKNNGANSPMSYETFLLNRARARYVKDRRNFPKPAEPGKKSYLIFKVYPFRKIKGTYFIKADLIKDKNTFIDGEVMCCMEEKYLYKEEMNQYKDMTKETTEILPNTMAGNVLTRFEANQNIKDTMTMTDSGDAKNDITDKKDTE